MHEKELHFGGGGGGVLHRLFVVHAHTRTHTHTHTHTHAGSLDLETHRVQRNEERLCQTTLPKGTVYCVLCWPETKDMLYM